MPKGENNTRNSRTELYKKIMRVLWIGLGAACLFTILFFFILSKSDLPSLEELENPKSELATEIYGDNLKVFGRFYTQNRIPVSYDELSPNLVTALVATEDERYYRHSGIDFKGLMRTFVKTMILGNESSGGASTITQQLAKLLFTKNRASNLMERGMQKFKEWIIAVRLERSYTKEEIMAMYLNKFDFINNAIGIKAASEIYFNTSQDSLTIEEAAVLVGMLKNPSLYNPNTFPERSLNRRNTVLGQMYRNDKLTKEEFDYLENKPLDMSKFKRSTQSEGTAPYFRAELAKDIRGLLKNKKKSDGSDYNIYEDGLKIYTTIDPEMQRLAEKEMKKHMKQLQEKFWKHWENKDPWEYKDRETSDREMEVRGETLTRIIRESERYKSLRPTYMEEVIKKIKASIKELRLRDVDIDRILEAEKDKRYLATLVRQDMISQSMEGQYRKVIRHPSYEELKAQWSDLQATAKKVFSKKVKMTVFAYNDKMETDTVMSPLDSIKYHQMFLQMGSMGVDPHTGHVKFWVGGIHHPYFKFDHVRTRRQVGSTFKPFVYATAIAQKGFSPCFQVLDMAYSIHPGEGSFHLLKEWQPANSNGIYTQNKYNLRDALLRSKNSVTVYLMKEIGSVEPVISMISAMGIDTEEKYYNGDYIVPRVPSIALGAADLTVQEMTGAYTTFANNGDYTKPVHILRIEDKNGRKLYESIPMDEPVLNPRYNYVMLDLLKHVAAGSRGFSEIKSPVGGKTGTTNDFVDGWFMGVTPNLVVGTWVGGDQNWIRFRSIRYGQGGVMARPFFQNFMVALEKDPELEWDTEVEFMRPPGDIGIELNCAVYEGLNTDGAFDESGGSIYDDGFGDELDLLLPKRDTSVLN